jgi:hypothetical protein
VERGQLRLPGNARDPTIDIDVVGFSGKVYTMFDDARSLKHEALAREWTDQFVMVNAERPELKRFAGIIGRVVTVNWNHKAIIDFQDGGWYDITASAEFLKKVDPAEAKAKYNAKANSAQPIPEKQGA